MDIMEQMLTGRDNHFETKDQLTDAHYEIDADIEKDGDCKNICQLQCKSGVNI